METKVPGGRIGIAPHSLRAVTLGDLTWAAATWRGQPAHIHVSEQTREVEDCLAAHGRRPIDLLLDTVEVDDHWCLVHATHADKAERARIAKAQAVVGLCPITEANLGDGLFDVPDFLAQSGRFGVGSDSNVRISAADELRTLEYGQRLIHRRRNSWARPINRPAAACSTPRSPAAAKPSAPTTMPPSRWTAASTTGCSPPTTRRSSRS
ncbi:MAG: amidohydrolase family protein, partial [Rhodospirillaceae bacterium]